MYINNPSDHTIELSKRQGSGSTGVGYIFLAVTLAAGVMMSIAITVRTNKKRKEIGKPPIYGTSWITPPSYRQSQNQYNQPSVRQQTRDPELPSSYVPTYSEKTNETDLGYYDSEGKFHLNPNAKVPFPPPVHPKPSSLNSNDRIVVSDSIGGGDDNIVNDENSINQSDRYSNESTPPPPPSPPPFSALPITPFPGGYTESHSVEERRSESEPNREEETRTSTVANINSTTTTTDSAVKKNEIST
ncbi:uncharacterized protein J8A68_003338 [[Candida] subhashii]|uniref:Uncharacterized protein n=1 Tax=[Candida] subhashii TaxID=561895 RepID=A0A8J5QVU9_9ASCO|nr:uncharacterized protein J8A68_003338 [[Candida] subhashii]KAG7663160.1 hypothetical protein J8A68_003338 [[Candida] subhashii]